MPTFAELFAQKCYIVGKQLPTKYLRVISVTEAAGEPPQEHRKQTPRTLAKKVSAVRRIAMFLLSCPLALHGSVAI